MSKASKPTILVGQSKPTILVGQDEGRHNREYEKSIERIRRGQTYRDCSTICIRPTLGSVPIRVVQSWEGLMAPMNQKFLRMSSWDMEVADAYNHLIGQILGNPELSKWKYVLTLEHDNMPPPDGLLRLLEAIEGGVDGVKYAAVGGLYWTKGEGGQPMCYGQPDAIPLNFIPWLPAAGTVARCNGLGMGFTLFRLSLFRDEKIEKPWFKTVQDYRPGIGGRAYTQDLWFFEKLTRAGYKVACDTRVLVGHYDVANDLVW